MSAKLSTALLSLLLSQLAILSFQLVAAENNTRSITIIEPEKKLAKEKSAAIDSESYELGVYFGSLSVEDFGTDSLIGASFTYHINNSFIARLTLGESEISRATFEDVAGLSFLNSNERTFSFTQVQGGYQIFNGRSFLGSDRKYDSHLYITAGLEDVSFAGNNQIGLVFGATYKLVATDWLTWDLNFQDHIFERDFIGETKVTHNIEMALGLNFLF
jgi:outer membrane beta-barrel protein